MNNFAELSLRLMSGIFTFQRARNIALRQVYDFMDRSFSGIIRASIRPWTIADFEKGLIMKMFSKSTVLAGVTAALLGFSVSAAAVVDPPTIDFTGNYDAVAPNVKWTQSPGDGSIDLTGAPFSVTLTGGDAGSPSFTTFTIAATSTSTVKFDWSYSTTENNTSDPFAGPVNDQALFLRQGLSDSPLSYNNAPANPDGSFSIQNGTASFSVLKDQVFGFSVWSQDGIGGSASLTISKFSVSPVPEPGSLAMLTAGLMVVVAARKRKQS